MDKDYEQARNDFFSAPDESEAKTTAFFNWISLCETPEQIEEAHSCAQNYDNCETEFAALVRSFELSDELSE